MTLEYPIRHTVKTLIQTGSKINRATTQADEGFFCCIGKTISLFLKFQESS